MKETTRFIVPILVGFVAWVLGFFLIGFTQMPDGPIDLYLPMVVITTIIWIIIIIFVFMWYVKQYNLKDVWLHESLVFGSIVALLQFLLDVVMFLGMLGYTINTFITDYLLKSTVLIMYPIIPIEVLLIAYFLKKYSKI